MLILYSYRSNANEIDVSSLIKMSSYSRTTGRVRNQILLCQTK